MMNRYRVKSPAGILGIVLALIICYRPAFSENNRLQGLHPKIEMTLADCVFLAVRHNRGIKSAYLDRVVQKYDLKVAEDEFNPDLFINPSVNRSSIGDRAGNRSITEQAGLSATVRQKIPTGADFAFTWSNTGQWNDEDAFSSSWDLSVKQPLLRGAGTQVNTVSLKTARINERINILSLKSTVMDTVTSAILAYRRFFQAQKQLDIAKNSLERAKRLLEVNKELIDAGRMARVEIVQTQADVANREVTLIQTQNALDNARLALLQVLDIDKHTQVVPVEKTQIKQMDLHLQRFQDLAFKKRPDYLNSLLALEKSEFNLVVAKNNKLWDLSLDGQYGIPGTGENNIEEAAKRAFTADRSNWAVGLFMNIPIGDLTREQGVISAKTRLKQQKLSIEELKDNIEIEIQDAVRDIEMKLRQVTLARQARKLSEQKLDIEKEKLKVGRSTNFQLVTFQNDLVSAQSNELNAVIDYLNALTNLDKTLGTTLETWKIELK